MSVVARVASYLRPYRARFAGCLALVAAGSLLEIAKPWPLKIVLDHVLAGRPLRVPGAASLGPEGLLLAACAGLLLLQIALAALAVSLNRSTIAIGQRMVNDLRADLVCHLQRLSLGFFARRPTSDLVYRVAYDTFAVQSMAMNGFFPLAQAVLLLGGMTLVMVRMNAALAAVFLGVAPLLFLTVHLLGRRIREMSTETRERESLLLSEIQRGVASIPLAQAFTAEERERERIVGASSDALRSSLRLHVFETGTSGAVHVLVALGTAAVLYAGGSLALAGRLSAGDLVVFVSYLAALYAPIHSLSATAAQLQGAAAGARRVFEILDSEPDVRDPPHPRPLGSVEGRVTFERVCFAYPSGPFALRDLSFDVAAGSLVALVGPTGAGKTTLVGLIPRFYDPVCGAVRLDGIDLRDLRLRALRERIGIVPQSPFLFPATLAENIRYGRPDASPEEVERAADLAGVSGFAAKLADGLDTPIGPDGQTLSAGQTQRVTIARALVRDPRILILDEPTSALDAETEAYVMTGIERAVRGRTTFVIAHRLSTVRRADLVLVLEDGRIVESGTYASLMREGRVLRRLHRAQEGLLLAPLAESGP